MSHNDAVTARVEKGNDNSSRPGSAVLNKYACRVLRTHAQLYLQYDLESIMLVLVLIIVVTSLPDTGGSPFFDKRLFGFTVMV